MNLINGGPPPGHGQKQRALLGGIWKRRVSEYEPPSPFLPSAPAAQTRAANYRRRGYTLLPAARVHDEDRLTPAGERRGNNEKLENGEGVERTPLGAQFPPT